MTIKEIIQRVQSLYSKGVQSDDSRLSSRHIYNKLSSVRTKLIKEAINKKQYISSYVNNVIPCVKLIKVPIHDCPCLPPKGCCVLRSENKLPTPISSKHSYSINSVSTVDGQIFFDQVHWASLKYQNSERYTKYKPYFYITNDYLYLVYKDKEGDQELELIRIEAAFEDMIEAYTYPSYCQEEEPCFDYKDFEFRIDNSFIESLIELTVRELIGVFNQNREDSSNNAKDNPEDITK